MRNQIRETSSSQSLPFYSPHKSVSLVLEDANLLDGAERGERLLQDLLAQSTGQGATDASAVHGTVGRTALVVDLVEGERLGVHCNEKQSDILSLH